MFFFANAVIAAAAPLVRLIGDDAIILTALALPVTMVGALIAKRLVLGSDAMHRHIAVVALGAIAFATAMKGLSALA